MSTKPDPYASEAETQALLAPDTRTEAERKLDKMMDELGAWEQGAEPYPLLRHIALELLKKQLAEQPAPVQQCMDHGECFGGKCIYPAPQPAQRKPLTDEQTAKAWKVADGEHNASASVKRRITQAIEAAHGITKGNT